MVNERISWICRQAACLRTGKTMVEMSQSEAMTQANKDWRDKNKYEGIRKW